MKTKTLGLVLLTVAATTLSGCLKKKTDDPDAVLFWSSFGSSYTAQLDEIVDKINSEKGLAISHKSKGSYNEINSEMISAISIGDYPNIAMGYPDHFATYLSSEILVPLDGYLSETEKADYYSEYMEENYFYDDGGQNAQKKLYGLPFNKSTELLGYNGVFVDYCASVQSDFGYSGLENIPDTWTKWEVQGPKYYQIYKSLFGKKLYGKQDTEGKASDFALAPASGLKELIDFTYVKENNSYLMSWDATDNAFITLVRQWGAEYTELPESQKTISPNRRMGNVLFNKTTKESGEEKSYQEKVVDMLKFFNKLNKSHIFGVPSQLGSQYSSDAFSNAKVMFMVCSSGGLSYNTAKWNYRFRVAPIPYKDESRKQVISQGANICLTDKGNYENSVAAIKALTTGKFQTAWCLATGYYPCSKSATTSDEYQAFIKEAETLPAEQAYAVPTRVAYREGSKLNNDHYMNPSEHWTKFVDPAFNGSSDLREVVEGVLSSVFSISSVDDAAPYIAKLNELETASKIQGKFNWIH